MKNKLKPIATGNKSFNYALVPKKHIKITSKNMILKNDFKSVE
jgi:hypothetical protein